MLSTDLRPISLPWQGTSQRTPYVWAAVGGNVAALQMLQDMGAKQGVRNEVSLSRSSCYTQYFHNCSSMVTALFIGLVPAATWKQLNG